MAIWTQIRRFVLGGPRRPLATRQPRRDDAERDVPLGMEATDLAAVSKVNRRNDALERVFGGVRPGARAEDRAAHVAPLPDDETYAARYHRAFQQKGS